MPLQINSHPELLTNYFFRLIVGTIVTQNITLNLGPDSQNSAFYVCHIFLTMTA